MIEKKKDRLVKKIERGLGLIGYYGFARYLPVYPRWFGDGVRRFFCRGMLTKCEKSSKIRRLAYLGTGYGIVVGKNSDIGIRCQIFGIGDGGEVVIGDNVMMAPDVAILTVRHLMDPSISLAIQGNTPTRVTIEDDVWIGIRTTVLPGVTIGKGAVVGACALVAKDVPAFSVVGGVPARVLRMREDALDIEKSRTRVGLDT